MCHRKIVNKVTPERLKVVSTAEPSRCWLRFREACTRFLNSNHTTFLTTVVMLYALLGDDVRLSVFRISADNAFFALSSLAFLIFVMEITLNCICIPGYYGGFYFVLDVVTTLSMITDIGWIWDLISDSLGTNNTSALKSGRASRAGGKASKIIRIVRLIRLVRLTKFVNFKSQQKSEKFVIAEPSKVGRMLTELTTRRLIILILAMIICLPFLEGFLDTQLTTDFQDIGLQILHRYPQDTNSTGEISYFQMKQMVEEYATTSGSILFLSICPKGCFTTWPDATLKDWLQHLKFQQEPTLGFDLVQHPETGWSGNAILEEKEIKKYYRTAEYSFIDISGCYDHGICQDCHLNTPSKCWSKAYFDTRALSIKESQYNIMKNIFIMVIIAAGAIFFTRDAETLVIGPIERMMDLVNSLAENPLGRVNVKVTGVQDGDFETQMLEQTLSKIGGLLQVGFGVAGSEIIAKNTRGAGALNVMIPGKKITSIFAFGIIEGFTNTCSALEETIITYINTIAEIIHADASMYYGAANKNIGSAFLLAWKICDGTLPGLRDPRNSTEIEEDREAITVQRGKISAMREGTGTIARDISPQEFVDSALTAVLKMRVDVHNANLRPSGSFLPFIDHPKVISTFGQFEVHMGFGLHIGWAIEGAIGSKYKIDASYLSPNVNLAARLEAATEQFQVPLLLSEWFVEELSPAARNFCRFIDRVTVKGSAIPMKLWTFDISDYPRESFSPAIDVMGRQIPVMFESDKIYQVLQKSIPHDFFTYFNMGTQKYIQGEWEEAKKFFQKSLALKEDGPTQLLLKFMGETDFIAPTTWAGYRQLSEK